VVGFPFEWGCSFARFRVAPAHDRYPLEIKRGNWKFYVITLYIYMHTHIYIHMHGGVDGNSICKLWLSSKPCMEQRQWPQIESSVIKQGFRLVFHMGKGWQCQAVAQIYFLCYDSSLKPTTGWSFQILFTFKPISMEWWSLIDINSGWLDNVRWLSQRKNKHQNLSGSRPPDLGIHLFSDGHFPVFSWLENPIIFRLRFHRVYMGHFLIAMFHHRRVWLYISIHQSTENLPSGNLT
jgi:hypothetical protein